METLLRVLSEDEKTEVHERAMNCPGTGGRWPGRSFRLVSSRPVPGRCPNRHRCLRRDYGGDILAGVPVPCAR
jgi:hypothetical protein